MNFHLKWSDLPPHLRKILIPAMILTVLVGFGGFMLSFQALSDWAKSTKLFPEEWSWIFPLIVDGGLVVGELLTVAAVIVAAPKLFPAGIMMLFGAATVWINLIHAPSDWGIRITAILPPTATICATLGIAWLGRRIAEALGMQLTYTPPPAHAVPPLPAQAWRTDGGSYPSPWAVPAVASPQLQPGTNPVHPAGPDGPSAMVEPGTNGRGENGSSRPTEGAGDTASAAGSPAPQHDSSRGTNRGSSRAGRAVRDVWRKVTGDRDDTGTSPGFVPGPDDGPVPSSSRGSSRQNQASTSGNTGVRPGGRPGLVPGLSRGGLLLPTDPAAPVRPAARPAVRPGTDPGVPSGFTAGQSGLLLPSRPGTNRNPVPRDEPAPVPAGPAAAVPGPTPPRPAGRPGPSRQPTPPRNPGSSRGTNPGRRTARPGTKNLSRKEQGEAMRRSAEAFVREHVQTHGQLPDGSQVQKAVGSADGWGRRYLRDHGDRLLTETLGNVRQIRAQQ